MNFTDALAWALRDVVQVALEMPENSVRPSRQNAPAGSEGANFATVFVYAIKTRGTPSFSRTLSASPTATDLAWQLDVYKEFTASVQFFKPACAPTTDTDAVFVDAQGIPDQNQWAFDQAERLPDRLWLPPARERMQKYGIAFLSKSGPARDLTEQNNALWESRGQIDLDFGIVNREIARVQFLATLSGAVTVAQPGGNVQPIDIEETL